MTVGAFLVGAVALVLLGRWGRGRAADLAPRSLSPSDRAHQARVLRRGANACFVAAGVFTVAAVGTLL